MAEIAVIPDRVFWVAVGSQLKEKKNFSTVMKDFSNFWLLFHFSGLSSVQPLLQAAGCGYFWCCSINPCREKSGRLVESAREKKGVHRWLGDGTRSLSNPLKYSLTISCILPLSLFLPSAYLKVIFFQTFFHDTIASDRDLR